MGLQNAISRRIDRWFNSWQRRQCGLVRIGLLVGFLSFAFVSIPSGSAYSLDNGEFIDFDAVDGEWVIIAYWAIWCGPCREEIQILNEIHRARDKYNVIVLGMNFDGVKGDTLAAQKARFGAEFPDLLVDPRARWDEPRPSVIPRTLIVNPSGEKSSVIVGSTTRREILNKIGR